MRPMILAVSLACAAVPALSATEQKQDLPPAAGVPKGFSVPTPRRFELPNGMKVTLVRWGTLPKATVQLSVRTGNVDEGRDEVWLADLTAALMKEGTARRSAEELAEAAARMGGALEIAVGEDRTEVGGDVLAEFGPEMLRLVGEVVREPRLPGSELPRLTADKLRELSIARSQPQQLAQERFRALLYGDHPYGRLFPSEAGLKSLTLEKVRAFWEQNFGAARAHLYVAGVFDEAAVEKAAREAFGDWKRGAGPSERPPQPRSERAVSIVDRPGAVQSTIVMGLPVIDPSQPDYVPLSVANTLLGGYFSSRITANIREQKGYTYSPYSLISSRRRDAYWAQNADVTTAVTGASLKEIQHEIDRLQAEAPSAAELSAVQNYLAGTFVLRNSTRAGIIAQLEFVELHGLPDSYLAEYVKRVHAVTPEAVKAMAAKHIADDRATIVIAGDRKAIEEQVKEFAPIRD